MKMRFGRGSGTAEGQMAPYPGGIARPGRYRPGPRHGWALGLGRLAARSFVGGGQGTPGGRSPKREKEKRENGTFFIPIVTFFIPVPYPGQRLGSPKSTRRCPRR